MHSAIYESSSFIKPFLSIGVIKVINATVIATDIFIIIICTSLSTLLLTFWKHPQTGMLVSLMSACRMLGSFFWTIVGNKIMTKYGTNLSRKICVGIGKTILFLIYEDRAWQPIRMIGSIVTRCLLTGLVLSKLMWPSGSPSLQVLAPMHNV